MKRAFVCLKKDGPMLLSDLERVSLEQMVEVQMGSLEEHWSALPVSFSQMAQYPFNSDGRCRAECDVF